MIPLAKTRKLRSVTVDMVPLRLLMLALFLLLGVLLGYFCSARCDANEGGALEAFFDAYLAQSASPQLTLGLVCRTLFCYGRACLLAFLFGFSSIGVLCLPALFAAQGFVLSFSLFSFAQALGREAFPALAALFAIRLLLVLPCTLTVGSAAWERSWALAMLALGQRRSFAAPALCYRFLVCCVILLTGCALELWLVPLFLRAVI